MNKKDLYFIGLLVVVLAVFMALWLFSRKAPAMTGRLEHAGITKETPRETCFECHGPGQTAQLPPHHPKKGLPNETENRPNATPTPCSLCHKLPPATTTAFLRAPLGNGGSIWQSRRQD